MSSAEESPAQRAARLRRERREAKIKDGGAARLDKITSLSGRTPQPARETSPASPSPSPQPPASISPAPDTPTPAASAVSQPPQPTPAPNTAGQALPPPPSQQQIPPPDDLQAQQEFIRTLLRQGAPPSSENGPADEEDPMMTLLSTLMKGATAGEQGGSPGPGPGAAPGPGGAAGSPIPGMSPADIASSLGVPPFLASMLGAATQPQTEAEKRSIWTWKVLHAVFSIVIGVYLLVVLGSSMATYGSGAPPPPPATARSPFLYFTTGELLLTGARVMTRSRDGGAGGLGMYVQLVRDVVRDGSVVIFLLGMGAWWNRGWMAY